MAPGGMIVVGAVEDAPAIRAGAAGAGLVERVWDNGTQMLELPR
jgi:hypothetical protein